jgi:hypothetical protein
MTIAPHRTRDTWGHVPRGSGVVVSTTKQELGLNGASAGQLA